MGRKSIGKQRRSEIIKSFYHVAKDIGLENTSLDKVAEYMQISKGLILHYFSSRQELLIGLNEFILESHLKVFDDRSYGPIDSLEKLEAFMQDLFSRKWDEYFDDGVFYSCYALVYRNESFRKSFLEYLTALHEVLRSKLVEAKDLGLISNSNIDEVTEVIFALIDGAYYYLGLFEMKTKEFQQRTELYVRYAIRQLDLSEVTSSIISTDV